MTWSEDKLIRLMEEAIPFNRMLGVRCIAIQRGRVRLRLPFRDDFIGDKQRPALHGGVISTLIDVAGGAAAFTVVGGDQVVSTVDLRVDYLLPGPSKAIDAVGEVIRRGNRVCLTDVVVTAADDPEGPAIARGRAVYNIVDRRR